MNRFIVAAACALATSPAYSMEVYRCDSLRGKSAFIDQQAVEWADDAFGSATVIIDDKRFLVVAGSFVPEILEKVIGDQRITYSLSVTSRDKDHIIGTSKTEVFQFHRPSMTLVNVGTSINNFPLPGSDIRKGFAFAFVARCR